MINNKQHRQNNRDTTANSTGRTPMINNKQYLFIIFVLLVLFVVVSLLFYLYCLLLYLCYSTCTVCCLSLLFYLSCLLLYLCCSACVVWTTNSTGRTTEIQQHTVQVEQQRWNNKQYRKNNIDTTTNSTGRYCLLLYLCCSSCTVWCFIVVVLPVLFVVVSMLSYLYCLLFIQAEQQ
jgi:uncharacterized membrane protein